MNLVIFMSGETFSSNLEDAKIQNKLCRTATPVKNPGKISVFPISFLFSLLLLDLKLNCLKYSLERRLSG